MRKKFTKLLLLLAAASASLQGYSQNKDVVKDFLNNRFGMFIHFNMGTFHAEQWALPGHDPKSFNPTALNCNQWAEAAASAKMSYAVFTTKHHDGFCLWDSSVTEYDVASSSYERDIVREYVDAFRKKGLKVGLYFSVWDRQHLIEKNNVSSFDIDYTKTQLTELLTNYGEITCLVIDGWGSVWGKCPTFEDIPYHTLADHIHSIQPNCLVINHSCKTDSSLTQVVHYEATHGQHCPYDNTLPSQQGPTIQPAWFWEKEYAYMDLKPLAEILSELDFCNSHNANYLLNAAPNDKGLMDQNVVERLKEVGRAWKKPADMKELPTPTKPHANVKAIAQSVGGNVARNVLDADLFTYWEPEPSQMQPSIILDYGKPTTFNKLVCGEEERTRTTKAFTLSALVGGKWVKIVEGKDLTFNFTANFEDITAQKFMFTITEKSGSPKISEITLVHYNKF
ncbi:MAG: alpha-L-fucosidase [Rikenellaceae bacterium]